MATLNPDGSYGSSLNSLQGILDKIIGSKTVGTDQRSLTTQQLMDQLIKSSQQETGSTTTTGTQDAVQQLISQLSGTTQQTTQQTADLGALRTVFGQQQGGITPDMLAGIFREGAKAAPQLVASTANALGARSGNNSAEAAALRDLNTGLVSQAATLNQQMLRDSAETAARIAQYTGSTTTTGSSQQGQTQNTSGQTTNTQQQNVQKLIDLLQNQTQSTNTNQQMRDDTTSTTGINTKQTGIAAGLAGLTSLLTQSGVGQDAITAIGKLFAQNPDIFTGGSGGTGLFQNPYDDGSSIPLPEGVGGYGGGPYTGGGDWDFGSLFGDGGGFADGGVVGQPKLLDINTNPKYGAPNVAQLLALLGGSSGSGLNLSGLMGSGGSSGGTGVGVGGDSSGGDGVSSGGGTSSASPSASTDTGFSTPVGATVAAPSIGQAIGLAAALASMNPVSIAQALANFSISNVALNSNISTINAPPDVALDLADPEAFAMMDTIDVGSIAGVGGGTAGDAASGGVGGESGGPGGSASGDAGSSGSGGSVGGGEGGGPGGGGDGGSGGDGGDGGGDGGWAHGGVIPKTTKDPLGIADNKTIRVSGGEGVLPTDVVDAIGPNFVHSLIALFHDPMKARDGRAPH